MAQGEVQDDPSIDIVGLLLNYPLRGGGCLFGPVRAVEQDTLDDARPLVRAEAAGALQETPTAAQLGSCDRAALCLREHRSPVRLELDRAKTQHDPRARKEGDGDQRDAK